MFNKYTATKKEKKKEITSCENETLALSVWLVEHQSIQTDVGLIFLLLNFILRTIHVTVRIEFRDFSDCSLLDYWGMEIDNKTWTEDQKRMVLII